MNFPNTPPESLPEPLRGTDPDSFARFSVLERTPEIGQRILAENHFPTPVVARLEQLIEGIPEDKVRLLADDPAPDLAAWNSAISAHAGQNWLEIPWFFAETYFFRRVLEATGYFVPGPGYQFDPYAYQKEQGLIFSGESIKDLCEKLEGYLNTPADPQASLSDLLQADLWGNQADLSLWPAGETDKPDHANLQQARDFLLIDDSHAAISLLLGQGARIDFLSDNAGFELVADLCLADFCLSHPAFKAPGRPAQVRFWLKAHPTFVSDAVEVDVRQTLKHLAGSSSPPVRSLARRLFGHLEQSRLVLTSDWFWTSPLSAWEMPPSLLADLAGVGLVISKGDANYRRLLGDRHWPFTTPVSQVLGYFPAPLLALRTHKSEVAIGLQAGQIETLDQVDSDWRVNGRWGVIQLYRPGS